MYDNEYNRGVCNKLSQLNRKVIEHENQISHSNEGEHKITTRLEGMCLRKKNVHGGSGYAAATVMDQGFERTEGAGVSAAGISAAGVSGAGGVRPIGSGSRSRKKKTGEGIIDTIGDVIHTVAPLAPLLLAAGKQPRATKTAGGVTGGDLSMLRYKELKGQPALTAPAEKKETIPANAASRQKRMTVRENMPGSYIAGAKPARKPNARNDMVRKVMKEHNLTLPMASKYVKDHNLYQK
jgi:hypothetical protein